MNIALDTSSAGISWESLILFLVPTWSEKGANLLHKKAFYLIAILFLVSKEIGIDNLMKWMDYKKRQTFRENYLLPLQKAALISMTKPEKPNDPEQKYKLTDNGRLFLAGRIV